MATYKTVGGVSPQYMGPEAALAQQKLGRMLIEGGMQEQPMRHWTQALGSVLQTGVGALNQDMGIRDIKEGQAAGNQALGRMLMGEDASAALANPYSADKAMDYQAKERSATLAQQRAESLQRMKLEAQRNDPMRQLQMEKLRREVAQPAGTGTVPAGYRLTAQGTMEAVPGGPADIKQANAKAADEQALSYSESAMNQLATAANELLQNQTGLNAVTGLSSYLPSVTAPARNADAQLETLKSKVAFSALQAMRDASKTGGALGQVTERELAMLQNSLVPLNQAQTKDQFDKALRDLIAFTEQSKARIRAGYNQKYGGGGSAVEPTTTPDARSVLKQKYNVDLE